MVRGGAALAWYCERMTKIRVGDFDVLSSGMVHAWEGEAAEFNLAPTSTEYLFKVKFASDESTKVENLEYKLVNKNQLELTLTNFDNPLGTSTIRPIPIGTHGDRRLYFMISVHSVGAKTPVRVLSYTFLLGETVNGGV